MQHSCNKPSLPALSLGFSGFSVHAQVASILAQTDIRFQPFFFARIAPWPICEPFCLFLMETIIMQIYQS